MLMSPGTVLSPNDTTAVAHLASACRFRIVQDAAEWALLEPQWAALWKASVTASPPLRWEWLWTWWRVYGKSCSAAPDSLRIVLAERDSTLVAAIPLYIGRDRAQIGHPRRLRFLSTGEPPADETCAKSLDVLVAQTDRPLVPLLMDFALRETRSEWDELDLTAVSPGSPLVEWAGSVAATAPGMRSPRLVLDAGGASFVANLEGGVEEYFKRLAPNSRWQGRRLLRDAKASDVVLELADDARSVDLFFDRLIELHQARWQKAGLPGCFSSPLFTEFHRTLAHALVPSGAVVLACLTRAGVPLAGVYGHVAQGKFDCYITGTSIATDPALKSVGTAAHLLLKAQLAQSGIARYDHLPGTTRFKQQYSTDGYDFWRVRVKRLTPRTVVHTIVDIGDRVVRRTARVVSSAFRSRNR
jgi:CelD/BcsL family acetyltransferase involved in cellulose biosynthesis